MDGLLITIDDIRKAGHCTAGARRWFETNRLDFRRFLKAGLPAEVLLATGDALAADVVAKARARRDG